MLCSSPFSSSRSPSSPASWSADPPCAPPAARGRDRSACDTSGRSPKSSSSDDPPPAPPRRLLFFLPPPNTRLCFASSSRRPMILRSFARYGLNSRLRMGDSGSGRMLESTFSCSLSIAPRLTSCTMPVGSSPPRTDRAFHGLASSIACAKMFCTSAPTASPGSRFRNRTSFSSCADFMPCPITVLRRGRCRLRPSCSARAISPPPSPFFARFAPPSFASRTSPGPFFFLPPSPAASSFSPFFFFGDFFFFFPPSASPPSWSPPAASRACRSASRISSFMRSISISTFSFSMSIVYLSIFSTLIL
mmetsp:Transcript_22378/g.56561  ORF Transcript_22378/g.56561 Transcript_22378/m.56561 type:complete len:305 (+) Transcript_22378:997-1911(+)